MSALSSPAARCRKRRSISLTPLIDIVFILLVFFMLASRLEKTRAIEMIPPGDGKGAMAEVASPPVHLIVIKGGAVKLADREIPRERLLSMLREDPLASYVISVSPDAALQDLVGVLDITAQVPGLKVALVAAAGHGKP